jgi:hypothetical protein
MARWPGFVPISTANPGDEFRKIWASQPGETGYKQQKRVQNLEPGEVRYARRISSTTAKSTARQCGTVVVKPVAAN